MKMPRVRRIKKTLNGQNLIRGTKSENLLMYEKLGCTLIHFVITYKVMFVYKDFGSKYGHLES